MLRTSRPCAVTTSGAVDLRGDQPRRDEEVRPDDVGRRGRRARAGAARGSGASRRRAGRSRRARSRARARAAPAPAARRRRRGRGRPAPGTSARRGGSASPSARRRVRGRARPTPRASTPQISPIVQRARSASRIGRSRFSVPRAASRTRASAAAASPALRSARTLRGALELALLGRGVDRLQLDRLLRLGRRTR